MPKKRFLKRLKLYRIEALTVNNQQESWVSLYEDTDQGTCQQMIDETPFGELRLVETIISQYVIANRPDPVKAARDAK